MGFGDMFKSLFSNQGSGYLDDLIHGGQNEIVLESDIVFKGKNASEVCLDIDGLVVDGNGYAIDANGVSGIFKVTAKNVLIKNLTFKNCSGTAISNEGELELINCTFTSNDRSIFNGNLLDCVECDFMSNSAKFSGAGIFNSGEMKISAGNFTGNSAKEFGGAIYNSGKIELDGCNFEANQSLEGGIRNYGEIRAVGCTFSKNTSIREGGAIYNSGTLSVEGGSFLHNSSKTGGAIYNMGKLEIEGDCCFTRNTAFKSGGAISNMNNASFDGISIVGNDAYDGGNAILNRGELVVRNAVISGNSSAAVLNLEGSAKIHDSKFLNSTSCDDVIVNEDFLQIFDTSFKDNESKLIISNRSKSRMGIFNANFEYNNILESAIFNEGKSLNIKGAKFNANTLGEGARNILNKSKMNLSGISIDSREKTIHTEKQSVIVLKDASEIMDVIEGEGRVEILEYKGDKFNFTRLDEMIHGSKSKEITLKDNVTMEDGEILFYEGGIDLDIDGLVIDGDGRIIDGSGASRIFIVTGNDITLKNITFKNGCNHYDYDNKLNSHGGALRINSGVRINLINCIFEGNTSEQDGGAICAYRKGKLNLEKCTFNKNHGISGGALYSESDVELDGCILSKNSANSGGAFYNRKNAIISNCTFSENETQHEDEPTSLYFDGGGAICNEGTLAVAGSSISQNYAVRGGSIYNAGNLNADDDCDFSQNTAKMEGGAIYNAGEATFESCVFNANTAVIYDGPRQHYTVSTDEGTVHSGDGFFKFYISMGGAIYSKSNMAISKCRFLENTAEEGAAIWTGEDIGDLPDCTFENNHSDNVYVR